MLRNAHSSRFSVVCFFGFILLSALFLKPSASFAAGSEISNRQKGRVHTSSDYVQPLSAVTVIGSRLPSFKIPFSNIPANTSYIPGNVSQEDREHIYETKPRSLQESLQDLEGAVVYDQVGNGVDATFSLRGFNESSAVITLLDGVRVNEVDGNAVVFPLINTDDLESIQVDRGSASPLFGNNAFAGVVHITTGQPSEKPVSLFGGYEYSNFGAHRFYQGISGTLQDKWTSLEGKFKYYFRGGRQVSNGFRSGGDFRITSFDIKTSYELPEESGRAFVHVKHIDDAISNPGAITFDQFQGDRARTLGDLDGRYMNSTIVSVGGDKKFFDDKLQFSVLASSRTNHVDFWSTPLTFGSLAMPTVANTFLTETKSRASDFVWQVAYQEDWGSVQNQSVLGMEMRDGANHSLLRSALLGFVSQTAAPLTDRSSSPKNVGLFWRETLNYENIVILHVGMRHDNHWLDILDHNTSGEVTSRWRDSTVSAGLTVRPVEFVDLFMNYSQGFRVPDISELSPFIGTVQTLNPEKSDSYEIGVRGRFRDKAQAKLSYFLIDLKDEIIYDFSTQSALFPFGRNINASKTRRTGIEARIDAKPIEEVELYASYTWTQAWVREINPTGTLVDGRRLGQIPESRWTLGLTARPLLRVCEACEGLKVGLYGVFTGKQHTESYETMTQAVLNATGGAGHLIKPYSVWDFVLSFEFKNQEIYMKVNNLFDERYYSRARNSTNSAFAPSIFFPAGATFTAVNPAPGREFIFGTRWEFDSLADFFTRHA